MKKPTAIILTDGLLHDSDAKTAHGLIRGSERYEIVGVVDSVHAGKDAGEILDGVYRNIPVFANAAEAIHAIDGITFCIIGIATVGGILPKHFIPIIASCIRQQISIVNGLHDFLSDIPELVSLANEHQVTLTDIRKPKNKKDLHFWNAEIYTVEARLSLLSEQIAL